MSSGRHPRKTSPDGGNRRLAPRFPRPVPHDPPARPPTLQCWDMRVDVLSQRVIPAPVSEVAAFASDPLNAPHWYENIAYAEWVGPPLLGVGGKAAFVASFLGRELRYTYAITEHVPDRRFVMRTAEGPFPMETTYEWEPAPEGHTLMRLRNRGDARGFSMLVAPVLQFAMRHANRNDLAALARVLAPDSVLSRRP